MKLRNLLPVLFGFFIMGFSDIVGVATSYVKTEFALSESLAGLIPSMVFLWFLILSVPTSLLCRKFGRRKMVIAGNVITLAGMIVPLLLFTFPACLTAFALLGIGNTILQVSLNPLLTDVVDGKALSSSLTAGQVIKAVSSFSGPFIVTFAVTAWGNWKMMFPVFAVLSVLSAAWLAMTPIQEKAETGANGVKGGSNLLFSPGSAGHLSPTASQINGRRQGIPIGYQPFGVGRQGMRQHRGGGANNILPRPCRPGMSTQLHPMSTSVVNNIDHRSTPLQLPALFFAPFPQVQARLPLSGELSAKLTEG